jgi:hypothetical protein
MSTEIQLAGRSMGSDIFGSQERDTDGARAPVTRTTCDAVAAGYARSRSQPPAADDGAQHRLARPRRVPPVPAVPRGHHGGVTLARAPRPRERQRHQVGVQDAVHRHDLKARRTAGSRSPTATAAVAPPAYRAPPASSARSISCQCRGKPDDDYCLPCL